MNYVYKITKKNILYLLIDLLIINCSYLLSFFLRFYPLFTSYFYLLNSIYFIILSVSYILFFYFFQSYRIMWEYSNIKDIYRLCIANVSGFSIFISFVLFSHLQYSRLLFLLTFFFIVTLSIFYRVFIRDFSSKKQIVSIGSNSGLNNSKNVNNILIVGASEAGRTILAEYIKIGLSKNIIGFVDDDLNKINKIFNGKMILATTDKIAEIITKYDIDEVIISLPSDSAESINKIVLLIKRKFKQIRNIKIKTLPSILEILNNGSLIGSLRDIGINDLIGREEVVVDNKAIELDFSDKVILVTGAGGSIGSEICKQLLKFGIKKLIAVGRGEFSIYNLIKTINNYRTNFNCKSEIIFKIANIIDFDLLKMIFEKYKPDVVFHTAAHKHVPLLEYNEYEAIQNNVIGTLNTLKLSKINNVEKFILISTDKAVNPVNIMGATKKIAEYLTLFYYKEKGLKTTIVRFGNVIGSRGSVIPLFQEQIENGGPVTVTHPEIKRYFMTIPESAILVINASAYSNGGEIFVLDMGKQYKILDIAKNLIKFYGYKPNKDIKIVFTGLRPGEKLYEELCSNSEQQQKTKNEKIFILQTQEKYDNKNIIEYFIKTDLKDFLHYNPKKIRESIKKVVKDYNYSE